MLSSKPTIFTDILGLLLLAISVSIHAGEFSLFSLIAQVLALAIYAAVVLLGLDWVGKLYFRRTGDEQGNQFVFVLLLFIPFFYIVWWAPYVTTHLFHEHFKVLHHNGFKILA